LCAPSYEGRSQRRPHDRHGVFKAERRALEQSIVSAVLANRSLQLSAPEAARLIRDAVGAGGELWVSGSGQSMHPTVRHADFVLVGPPGPDVHLRDVVLIPFGPRLMLHRVVEVQKEIVLTRGDARERRDPPVRRVDVVARALAVRRDDIVTPLTLTMRFGFAGLVRFLLSESVRRARQARAMLRTGLRKLKRDA